MRLCAAYSHRHCNFIVIVYAKQMKLLSTDNRRLDFRTRPKAIAHISHWLKCPDIWACVYVWMLLPTGINLRQPFFSLIRLIKNISIPSYWRCACLSLYGLCVCVRHHPAVHFVAAASGSRSIISYLGSFNKQKRMCGSTYLFAAWCLSMFLS